MRSERQHVTGFHPPINLRALNGRPRRPDDLPELDPRRHEALSLVLCLRAHREPHQLPVGPDRVQRVPYGRDRGGQGEVRRHRAYREDGQGPGAYLGRLCEACYLECSVYAVYGDNGVCDAFL